MLAPSSRVALYLAAVIAVHLLADPRTAIAAAVICCVVALAAARAGADGIAPARLRAAAVFIAWVFVMRAALDVIGGDSPDRAVTLLTAGRQAARVAVLVIGALAVIAMTPARAVVDELETTRLPRTLRLLVMMLVQYPRVLRDRYDQIVEAQVARGADRPRTVVQRIGYASRVLLPVMQSELNAIGERAGLIHMRGLDVEVVVPDDARSRTAADAAAVGTAILLVMAAGAARWIR